jgi:phage host-nuclease inhibitor protein Gam
MARINLTNEENYTSQTLDELIPQYAFNKNELDSYTKICKEENEQIKAQLAELGENEYSAGGYTAKRIVAVKESMNEAKLLEVLRQNGIDAAIKTKEYVDMDALEAYLYNNAPSAELARQLEGCRTTTQTVQLRLSKTKAKKED